MFMVEFVYKKNVRKFAPHRKVYGLQIATYAWNMRMDKLCRFTDKKIFRSLKI